MGTAGQWRPMSVPPCQPCTQAGAQIHPKRIADRRGKPWVGQHVLELQGFDADHMVLVN